jgi:hypothetical protein
MARQIKLSGREAAVLRTVGFGLGVPGNEVAERTQMVPDELVDILNSLLDIGYLETSSMRERVTVEDFGTENFEINPGFAQELKHAMRR